MGINSRYLSLFSLCALAAIGSGNLQAAAITGTFTVNGSVRVTPTAFDWAPLAGGTGTVSAGLLGNDGYFALLTGNATIDDLNSPEATAGNPVPNFLTAFTGPGFGTFFVDQVLFIAPSAPICVGPIAVNASCALGNSTLTQLANGVTVSLNVTGLFKDTVNTDTTAFGSFTTQLGGANSTVQGVLTSLGTTGFIDSSFSATFTSVPEPSTYGLAGAALLAMLAGKRFRRN